MKKKISIGIVIFIVIFIVIGCSKENIKIGYVAGLSDRNSELGVSGRNGFLLALEEYNEGDNKYNVEPIVVDDQNSIERYPNVWNELRDNGVKFVIGPQTSATTNGIIDIKDSGELLIFSPLISTPLLEKQDDYFIRIISMSNAQGKPLGELVVNDELSKPSAIYDKSNEQYALGVLVASEEVFIENDIEYISKNAVDFENLENIDMLLKDLKNDGVDSIVLITSAINAAYISQKNSINNYGFKLYGSTYSTTNDLIEQGGKAVEGFKAAGIVDLQSKDKDYFKFKEKYIVKYNIDPTFASIFTYDTTKILLQALDISENNNTVDIKEAIINKSYTGLQNQFFINEFGDSNKEQVLFEIKNGEFRRLEEYE
jgi:branched-chain amino acid transport system substrate-binding protein